MNNRPIHRRSFLLMSAIAVMAVACTGTTVPSKDQEGGTMWDAGPRDTGTISMGEPDVIPVVRDSGATPAPGGDGVCCPVSPERVGCNFETDLGGWAANGSECVWRMRLLDAWIHEGDLMVDSHGCPRLALHDSCLSHLGDAGNSASDTGSDASDGE